VNRLEQMLYFDLIHIKYHKSITECLLENKLLIFDKSELVRLLAFFLSFLIV